MSVAIIGGGWAGLACAIEAVSAGHDVSLFEASRHWGGRARAVHTVLPDGTEWTLDNGQHILIGAYGETLRLLQKLGVDAAQVLQRRPLDLRFADQSGLVLGKLPSPLDALWAIMTAKGWSLADKASLLWVATQWVLGRFSCGDAVTVATLCRGLTPRVRLELIDPLCVSALNTPAESASGRVFLRVLKDSLFGASGSSNLLLPRVDLSRLFPSAAIAWLALRGAQLNLGTRVSSLEYAPEPSGWVVNGQVFDQVVLATDSVNAGLLLDKVNSGSDQNLVTQIAGWADLASQLRFEAISTVYATVPQHQLAAPMTALRSNASFPAQFVFDKGRLGGPQGLLAFVVSASQQSREDCQQAVLHQALVQLGLRLKPVQTIVEKRATFACLPNLRRPGSQIANGLLACGDYIDGPYPATLEGAVRSGIHCAKLLGQPWAQRPALPRR